MEKFFFLVKHGIDGKTKAISSAFSKASTRSGFVKKIFRFNQLILMILAHVSIDAIGIN